MTVMNIQWNNCGSVLAVAGMQRAAGQVNEQTISDNCNSWQCYIYTLFITCMCLKSAPAKQSQLYNTTSCNIVEHINCVTHVMFGQHVVPHWVLLAELKFEIRQI